MSTPTKPPEEELRDIKSVIVMSRYALYINGKHGPIGRFGTGLIVGEFGEELDLTARSAVFERRFASQSRRLLAAGKRVILVYPVPEIGSAFRGRWAGSSQWAAIPPASICHGQTSMQAR